MSNFIRPRGGEFYQTPEGRVGVWRGVTFDAAHEAIELNDIETGRPFKARTETLTLVPRTRKPQ